MEIDLVEVVILQVESLVEVVRILEEGIQLEGSLVVVVKSLQEGSLVVVIRILEEDIQLVDNQ